MDDVPEMVERVARAIYDAENGIDGDTIAELISENDRIRVVGDDLGLPATMEVCRVIASAAIAAMREPNQHMLSRGSYHCITGAGAVNEGDMRQAKAVYQAMIDRALLD